MKRLTAIILLLVILLALCACGKPDNISNEAYTLGQKAVQIADDYLDFKISQDEAIEQMSEISKRFDTIPGDGESDVLVKLNFSTLNLSIAFVDTKSFDDGKVKDARNSLADTLGMRRK